MRGRTLTYDPSTFYYVGLDNLDAARSPQRYACDGGKDRGDRHGYGRARTGPLAGGVDVEGMSSACAPIRTSSRASSSSRGIYDGGDDDDAAPTQVPVTASDYALAAFVPLTSMDMQILSTATTSPTSDAWRMTYRTRSGIIAVAAALDEVRRRAVPARSASAT